MSTHASLEEESRQENCDDGMRARNELLGDTYTTMQSLLEKLYSYVCLAFGGEGTLRSPSSLVSVADTYANRWWPSRREGEQVQRAVCGQASPRMLGFDEHGHEEYAPPPYGPPHVGCAPDWLRVCVCVCCVCVCVCVVRQLT
jgi:hypothetical protein